MCAARNYAKSHKVRQKWRNKKLIDKETYKKAGAAVGILIFLLVIFWPHGTESRETDLYLEGKVNGYWPENSSEKQYNITVSLSNPGINEGHVVRFDRVVAKIGPGVGNFESNSTLSYVLTEGEIAVAPNKRWSITFPSGNSTVENMPEWTEYGKPCICIEFFRDSEKVIVVTSHLPLLEELSPGNDVPLDFMFR